MKQNKGPLILLTAFTIFLFRYNVIIQESVLQACEVFITKLFPTLFPMMVLTDCFLYFGLPDFLMKHFGKFFQKCFRTSSYGVYVFLIACFSGTPTNAYTIKNLYLQNYISKEEGEKLLSFTFFSNPLFLYSMLKLIFPSDNWISIKLLLLPYLINIFLGIFSKGTTKHATFLSTHEVKDFGSMLIGSIKGAMNTLLMILGTVSIFFVLNAIFNPMKLSFVSGLLEISQGLNSLIGTSFSWKLKECLAIFMISFGGLSIHLQVKGVLSDTDLSYTPFFIGRVKQTVLGLLIVFFL